MDYAGIGTLITAIVAVVVALYRWAVAQGKKEAIAEQVEKTLAAKDQEIAELREDNTMLESWVESLTRPPEKSP